MRSDEEVAARAAGALEDDGGAEEQATLENDSESAGQRGGGAVTTRDVIAAAQLSDMDEAQLEIRTHVGRPGGAGGDAKMTVRPLRQADIGRSEGRATSWMMQSSRSRGWDAAASMNR